MCMLCVCVREKESEREIDKGKEGECTKCMRYPQLCTNGEWRSRTPEYLPYSTVPGCLPSSVGRVSRVRVVLVIALVLTSDILSFEVVAKTRNKKLHTNTNWSTFGQK